MTDLEKATLVSLLEIYQLEEKKEADGDPAKKVVEECCEVLIAKLLGSEDQVLEEADLLMSLILRDLPLPQWQRKMNRQGRELFPRQKKILEL